jgi:coenzyme F420-dependent glucose-6-phosphate dehydrogenase
MQTSIGFHASHEQYAPGELLRAVQRAEKAGFQAAMCSDHFHPWSERQAHSAFAWSWLGAALEATGLTFGTVCAPGQRYHPAIVAQAAATLAAMYPGRFWLAVGSGENLNEHITGEPWPEKEVRNARLEQSVDIMRRLWSGETVSCRGHVVVDRAQLFTRPAQPPAVIGAALSTETAQWMGPWVDGLITVGMDPPAVQEIIDAFRSAGGEGKPVYLQSALSYAPTQEEAEREAWDQWRHAVLDSEQFSDLAMPADFDAACTSAKLSDLRDRIVISSDLNWYVDWLSEMSALDLTTIYLHPLARNLDRFIDVFAKSVLPRIHRQ